MRPGRNVELVLLRSLGETSRTIVDSEGRVLATGGSNGCLWFVTTKRVACLGVHEKAEFIQLLKDHLECVRKFSKPEDMTNMVHEENSKHIRLLRHLGATFAFAQIVVPETGARFRQFWL